MGGNGTSSPSVRLRQVISGFDRSSWGVKGLAECPLYLDSAALTLEVYLLSAASRAGPVDLNTGFVPGAGGVKNKELSVSAS